jgi:hypothetical protein
MANAIIEVFCDFGLAEKTLVLTTDNASSMIICDEFISRRTRRRISKSGFHPLLMCHACFESYG